MLSANLVNVLYLAAAVLFILDLKWMAHPRTAIRGNVAGVLGMVLAVAATVLSGTLDLGFLLIAVAVGSAIGTLAALRIKLTAMPEMVGLLNGFGGGASVLVAGSALVAVMTSDAANAGLQMRVATVATAVIGSITFFGSYVAFGKLAEMLAVRWKLKPWQRLVKYGFSLLVAGAGVWLALAVGQLLWSIILAGCALAIAGLLLLPKERFPGMGVLKVVVAVAAVSLAVVVAASPGQTSLFWVLTAVAGLLGVLLTLSIGGADMPVVIALLNSYSGLAAAATGFVINNSVLIISGSLVGASGIILTSIMCKAMNRSLTNVLFGSIGPGAETPASEQVYQNVKATSADEVAMVLEGAQRVVIVPGYGMAVAQAQHAVRDLAHQLEQRGIEVEYAIHPVAGRMPGHMNVLLAEADISYDRLREMDETNSTIAQADVAIVLGANDVVNPSARTDPSSPIAGMPIIDVDRARTVVVIKRSLSPGFAGIPNPLFAADNTLMLFGDGKQAMLDLVGAVKEAA